jgi:exonuclease SbcC
VVRVEIHNFQSIAHEVVEVEGFSAIVGRSNIGKSAIVRAVKAALTGAPVDAYVRHSSECPRITKGNKTCQCFCSVRIQAEGFDLLWEKGDSVNQYTYNGEKHTVAGRGTPEFLADVGLDMVKIGTDKTLIQVSDQFRPIFILDKSGTAVADVLSDVAKLDQINAAMRLAEKDRKEAAATRKVRLKDIKDLETSLESYIGLEGVLERSDAVAKLVDQKEEVADRVGKMERLISSAKAAAHRVKELSPITEVQIPSIDSLVDGGVKFQTLSTFKAQVEAKEKVISNLGGVSDVELPEIDQVEAKVSNHLKLTGWSTKVAGLKSFFESMQSCTLELPGIEPLEEALKSWSRCDRLAQKLAKAGKAAEAAEADFNDVQERFDRVAADFQSLGVCPTCSRPFEEGSHV